MTKLESEVTRRDEDCEESLDFADYRLALYAGNAGHMEERYRMFFRWRSLLLRAASV